MSCRKRHSCFISSHSARASSSVAAPRSPRSRGPSSGATSPPAPRPRTSARSSLTAPLVGYDERSYGNPQAGGIGVSPWSAAADRLLGDASGRPERCRRRSTPRRHRSQLGEPGQVHRSPLRRRDRRFGADSLDRQARDRRGAVEISEPGPLLCEVDVDNGHHQLGETLLYGGFADLSKQVEADITLRTAPMDRVGTCSTSHRRRRGSTRRLPD